MIPDPASFGTVQQGSNAKESVQPKFLIPSKGLLALSAKAIVFPG